MSKRNRRIRTNTGAGPESSDKPSPMPSGQPPLEPQSCPTKKRGYFSKPENWVSLLTLIAVSIYTGISAIILYYQREQEKRSLRAYLLPSSFTVERLAPSEKFIASVTFKNYGETPAKKLTIIEGQVNEGPYPINVPVPRDGARFTTAGDQMAVGRDGVVNFRVEPDRVVDKSEYEQIIDGTKRRLVTSGT